RREFDEPQTVALTATATEFVQSDIVDQLGMPDAEIVVSGFERPNLYFEVFHARGKDDKLSRLEALIDHHEAESIIVYGATRKQVREVGRGLNARGVRAGVYHGGMEDEERSELQERWMEGEVPVLVATNAFGMGVDKADVRAVVHYNMPGSVEAYYQEAGRAGRDGERAHCVLMF
ncbi:MAG: helicase-related protein, partial [Bradymonadaceae bacterium]